MNRGDLVATLTMRAAEWAGMNVLKSVGLRLA